MRDKWMTSGFQVVDFVFERGENKTEFWPYSIKRLRVSIPGSSIFRILAYSFGYWFANFLFIWEN